MIALLVIRGLCSIQPLGSSQQGCHATSNFKQPYATISRLRTEQTVTPDAQQHAFMPLLVQASCGASGSQSKHRHRTRGQQSRESQSQDLDCSGPQRTASSANLSSPSVKKHHPTVPKLSPNPSAPARHSSRGGLRNALQRRASRGPRPRKLDAMCNSRVGAPSDNQTPLRQGH